jgi:GT2 family glycosyltransferase
VTGSSSPPCRTDADPSSYPVAVTVIVVNHNGGDLLVRCLEGVASQTVAPVRILVMDNGSTDGSVADARRCCADDARLAGRTEMMELDQNLGFAAANNRAIMSCETEYVALLNPDAFPHPRWLERLLDAARRHPEASAFGSRQMLEGSPGVLDGIGDVFHVSGLSWREGHGRKLREDDLEEREIFSPCAAAALYRREALVEVGGFDEDFFCYFEDVDLGFRLRLAGYAARSVAAAGVSHMGAASTGGPRSNFAVYHGHRNLIWCFVKNMPFPLVLMLLPGHAALLLYDLALFTLRGCGAAVVAAKWHAVVGLPKFLGKRRAVQAMRRATCRDIWGIMDHRCWPKGSLRTLVRPSTPP